MSIINNCCCGETTTPPTPGITAQQSCALSETIMSQTGLITDLNCGIKPVIGEILGVQMQSTRITVDSVPAPHLTSTEAKDTFVFGYALSRNMCETTSTEGEEERFVAIPYPSTQLSPIEGTIPCYWVWWTKNRSLELDIKFPNNNFSGCIEQDRQYYVAENWFWCGAYADNSGLQGAWSHDGNSCWRGSQWAPSDLTNLYSETDGTGRFGWTDYAYVDHYQSAYSIRNGSGIVGFGCCTGWGHSNCSPADWQGFGVNEVGGYHNEGSGGHQYYSSYELKRLSHHNPKYPASTIEERLAAATVGGGSCYDYEGQGINKQPGLPPVIGKQVHLHKCWRNDQSNPRRYDFEYGDAADKVGANCKDVVVNGLTPYQRRVSQERSPDIWEIHEFNDSLPIKIKVQDFSIDRPAVVKIWGLDSEKTLTTLRGLEDGISKYTDISCGGNNISLVRQNFEPRIYSVYQSPDEFMVSPTKSRKTIIIGNGNVINTDILQGAEMLYRNGANWYIGGSGSGRDRFPSDNFIKKVSTGFNHTICTRDNYTAEVSKTTVNESGDRLYYSSSIPTAIEINSGVINYNQIDIPYSPGSKRFKYDWIAHGCTADGCTSCKYPLFANKDHTVTQDDYFGIQCGPMPPQVGDTIKIPSGSCRFTNTNPNLIEMSCGIFTPWCAPCFGFDCPKGDCPPDICYPGDPMINPGFGVLSCQGSDNNWNTVANLTKCTATPTPFCNAGYPPLICGTPEGSNQYICGTGGFNSILHDYTDYKVYSCGLPELETTNYDKNYCEGVQVWDSISAGGYHNVAINKHSNFSALGATSCTCPNPETNVYPFGDAYNPGKNVVAWGAGENYSTIWPHFGQSLVPANIGHCKKVSGGAYHSLAIDENYKIRAWGAGGPGVPTICPEQYDPEFVHFGQSNIPIDIKDIEFIEISAGQFHSCGIRKDNGLVMCWGAGWTAQADGGVCQVNWGQSIVGATLGKCISISAGGYHTCAITELGTVKCWGKNVNGQCTAPSDPCVQISCGLEFSAGRFIEDLYETFPYWNHSNQRSSPALATDKVTDGFWPISLYRYFFAFASMEFTYGRGETPLTPGICDVDWGRSLPKAYHQRSDAVHIFAFETEIYNGNDSGLAEQLMEEDLSMYIYQGEPIQVSWGHMGDGYSAVEPGWHTNANKVNRNLSDYYWADRMSCKDWRQEIWDDLTIINGAAGLSQWPALADLREKYSTPSKIKPVGAYRIRGDKFDIRDARGNELNTSKRPPELAKMACTTVDNNPTFTNLNCVGRIVIPPEYYDSGVEKYTLQVNSDIYGLTMPDNIYFNREQLDAYNRLTLSVYFRPKPIGWEYSGPDWAYSDWPTPEISATTGGARSWRYGWLQTDRRKSRPRTYTDKGSTIMSTGIGTNTLQGNAVQGQPFWDTYNRGYVDTKISSTLGLTVSCDFIGPQVAYTYNAHIYAARHLPGINTKGGVITQSKQGTSYPMQYEPKWYTCSLFNIT